MPQADGPLYHSYQPVAMILSGLNNPRLKWHVDFVMFLNMEKVSTIETNRDSALYVKE